MPTNAEYQHQIRRLQRPALLSLWRQILAGDTPGWAAGRALEYLVLRAFELDGAAVTWPFNVSVGGATVEQIDGVIYADGIASLVECKDSSRPVNFEPLAKLRQQLLRRPPSVIGCCFARSGFTPEAMLLAERSSPQNVLLWQGDEIEFGLKRQRMRSGLLAKFRHSVEHALPDFKIDLR